MRSLRLFAVVVWLAEMAWAWMSVDAFYRQGFMGCQPAWWKRQAGQLVADCRHHSDHLMGNAWTVVVVCTAVTVGVLLLSWLPFRWFSSPRSR